MEAQNRITSPSESPSEEPSEGIESLSLPQMREHNTQALSMIGLGSRVHRVPRGSMVEVIVLRSITNLWTASVYGDPDTHYVHRIRPRPPAPVVIKRCNDYPYYCSNPNGLPKSHYKRLFIALESASSQWQHLTPTQEGIFGNFLIDELASMIFGSNTLAKAGADETVNWQLCRKVFQETPVGDLCSADPA